MKKILVESHKDLKVGDVCLLSGEKLNKDLGGLCIVKIVRFVKSEPLCAILYHKGTVGFVDNYSDSGGHRLDVEIIITHKCDKDCDSCYYRFICYTS